MTLNGTGKSVYDGKSFVIDSVPGGSQFTISPATAARRPAAARSPTARRRSRSASRSGTSRPRPACRTTGSPTVTPSSSRETDGTTGDGQPLERGKPVTIICSGNCNSFTYSVPVSPGSPGHSAATPDDFPGGFHRRHRCGRYHPLAWQQHRPRGHDDLVRSTFANGDTVSIASSGTAVNTESAYVGSYRISCTSPCSTFTFSGFTLTPTTTGSGSMSSISTATPPDRDTVIKWLRGADNFGDEYGPGGAVTVRPSIACRCAPFRGRS